VNAGYRPLSARLCQEARADLQAWLDLPIPAGIAAGTLPVAVFRTYLEQDYHYLRNLARVYAKLVVVAPDRHIGELLGLAWSVQTIEMVDQSDASELFGCDFATSTMDALTRSYLDFLLEQAQSYAAGLVAMVPCTWGYGEALQAIPTARAGAYRPWLNTYCSASYRQIVERVLALVDDVELDWDEACRILHTGMAFEADFWSRPASRPASTSELRRAA
jgi:thiaminase/transcriptional activator TenA